jgi:hypothetical protein
MPLFCMLLAFSCSILAARCLTSCCTIVAPAWLCSFLQPLADRAQLSRAIITDTLAALPVPPERVSNVQEPVVLMHQVRLRCALHTVCAVCAVIGCMRAAEVLAVCRKHELLMCQVRECAWL